MITSATLSVGRATLWKQPCPSGLDALPSWTATWPMRSTPARSRCCTSTWLPAGQYTMRLIVLAVMLVVMGSAELIRSLSTEQAFTGDGAIAALALISAGMANDGDRLAGR